MELVEGLALADRIRSGPIPIGGALPIAKQMCEALEAPDVSTGGVARYEQRITPGRGVPSHTRSPRNARPQRRVISVATPLSSRKISFDGSIWSVSCRHTLRWNGPAAMSCSAAWSDLFSVAVPFLPAPSRIAKG